MSIQEEEGCLAYFESCTRIDSPPHSPRKWTRYDIVYTLPRGPVRRATTFDHQIGLLFQEMREGQMVRIYIKERGIFQSITRAEEARP